MLPSLSLVLGTAASGKSEFAENLALGSALSPVYVATARALDTEMGIKLARHKARRGTEWTTIEAPESPEAALAGARTGQVVLLDCATMWLSNLIAAQADIAPAQAGLLAALAGCRAPVVVVSNELGGGIVPDNALARQFREAQGRLNIALAAQAGLVVNVVAGLPQLLKGAMP